MRYHALWWWIDRWRKSTAYTDMTLEEQGAYRNLLDEAQLRGGSIPNDERILAKACGDATRWKKIRDRVLSRFELRSDGWHNDTLDEVIRESKRRAETQRKYRVGRGNTNNNVDNNALDNAHDNNGDNRRDSPISGSGSKSFSLKNERKTDALSPGHLDPSSDETLTARAGRFLERYGELYQRHLHGACYVGRPTLDFQEALQLVRAWDDERLDKLVEAFLKTDHDFAEKGSRTVAQFRSMASWCDVQLRRAGL